MRKVHCVAMLLSWLVVPGSWIWANPVEYSISDFGAVGDGSTDNTAAFQKAIDQAYDVGGGIIRVPTGKFVIRGNLEVPSSVVLQGTFCNASSGYHDPGRDFEGSTLLAYTGRGATAGKPFIHLKGRMAGLQGFLIRYPEATYEEVPPVPYPPCVLITEWDIAVQDCCILNAYHAVQLRNCGRHLLRNVHGYPTYRGIVIDYCQDIGRLENCHFSPRGFEFNPSGAYMQWVFKNGVAFEIAHTDWQYVTNTFCFGYDIGYKFTESETGTCNGNFLGIGADSCRVPVCVEQASPVGLLITNGEFVGQWGSKNSVCVDVGPNCRGRVNLSNCSFWGPNDRLIWMKSPKAGLIATGCNFVEWDNDLDGSPAVQLDAGRAIIQACSFADGQSHIRVAAGVQAAAIMGNQSPVGVRIENLAGKRARLSANEEDTIEWTTEARQHYRIDVGEPGDTRYLEQYYGVEGASEWKGKDSKRWLGEKAAIKLPVQPGRSYQVSIDLFVPQHAAGRGGIYVGSRELKPWGETGTKQIVVDVPAQDQELVTLDLRGGVWVPREVDPRRALDDRRLVVAVRSITVRAQGAGPRTFDANTGQWID